jgi:hypothetical protein
MAPPAGGVGTQVAAGTAQQQPAQQGLGQVLFGVVRMGLFWYFAMQMFGGSKKVTNPALLTNNLFSKGEDLDVWLYISEAPKFTDFGNEAALVWHETNVPYAVWTPNSVRRKHYVYHTSEVSHNHRFPILNILSFITPMTQQIYYSSCLLQDCLD